MQRILVLLLFAGLALPAAAQQQPQPGAKNLDDGTVRISAMGPDADPAFDALHPAVAYNSTSDEYFVVWAGTDNSGSLVAGETEIYARRVDPVSAQPIGERIRVSEMGADGDPSFAALHPAVAYNPVQDAYLIVWQGSTGAGEFEIYGRTVQGADRSLGVTQRLTRMGMDGDATVHALAPSLAVNTDTGAYYVVWYSNAGGEVEAYGRVLDARGLPASAGPTTLSAAGPAGDLDRRATDPVTAYDATTGGYWVAWSGSEDIDGLAADENEIFVRQVASDGTPANTGASRISQAGTDGDARIDAVRPQIVVDASLGEVFVTWSANAPDGGGAFEIYAQRIDAATGTEVGTNDLRLSTMGAGGETAFSGFAPVVAGTSEREYRVIWRGDDINDDAFELYTQAVFADRSIGDEGPNDDVLLTALSGGSARLGVVTAAVAQGDHDTYFVVWSGDTEGDGFARGEHEIFGRIVGNGTTLSCTATLLTESDPYAGEGGLGRVDLTFENPDGITRLAFTKFENFALSEVDPAPSSQEEAEGRPTLSFSAAPQAIEVRLQQADGQVASAAYFAVASSLCPGAEGGLLTTNFDPPVGFERVAPGKLELTGSYPNPTQGAATIEYGLPEAGEVRVAVYDALGRWVATLASGPRLAGRHQIRWDGRSGAGARLASGLYFVRLEAGSQVRTRRLTIVR